MQIPANLFWRMVPFVILVAFGVWGLVASESQWRVLYSRSRRYRDVRPSARIPLVRYEAKRILILSVAIGGLLWFLP